MIASASKPTKLTILISGPSTRVSFRDPINVSGCATVRKATIFWEYENSDGTFGYNGFNNIKRNLDKGYYTFDDIASLMSNDDITLSKVPVSRKCSLDTATIMDAKLKKMLGYTMSRPNGVSQNKVDINHGLRYIKILCNIVTPHNSISENGLVDRVLLALPVTSSQSLNGTIQDCDLPFGTNASLDTGPFSYLDFTVTDQDDKAIDVGSILLDMYIYG